LTVEELERSMCACGGEDCDNHTIYIHSRCHPSDATEVFYTKGTGKLVIRCKTCRELVAEIAVASGLN
jgi:hypothetical protein